jgi:hypothetical protein
MVFIPGVMPMCIIFGIECIPCIILLPIMPMPPIRISIPWPEQSPCMPIIVGIVVHMVPMGQLCMSIGPVHFIGKPIADMAGVIPMGHEVIPVIMPCMPVVLCIIPPQQVHIPGVMVEGMHMEPMGQVMVSCCPMHIIGMPIGGIIPAGHCMVIVLVFMWGIECIVPMPVPQHMNFPAIIGDIMHMEPMGQVVISIGPLHIIGIPVVGIVVGIMPIGHMLVIPIPPMPQHMYFPGIVGIMVHMLPMGQVVISIGPLQVMGIEVPGMVIGVIPMGQVIICWPCIVSVIQQTALPVIIGDIWQVDPCGQVVVSIGPMQVIGIPLVPIEGIMPVGHMVIA